MEVSGSPAGPIAGTPRPECRWSAAAIVMVCISAGVPAQEARDLFSAYSNRIYQIRLIELSTENRAALGSGFRVSNDGRVITNYHVVSEYLHNPDRYRVEFLAHDKSIGVAQLLDFDIVNDLALLEVDHPVPGYLRLATDLPEQGEPIYSIGNPHDLGLTVIPGTYNGIATYSYYERIHFSGSINSGMSGGPVLNAFGEVIGVNVASAGNGVGFLIALPRLAAFISQARTEPMDLAGIDQEITTQLEHNQANLMGELIDADWQLQAFGDAVVPGEIAAHISCWGGVNDDPEARFERSAANCQNSENVFIASRFQTGVIHYAFSWFESDQLNTFQFYNLFETFMGRMEPDNRAREENVTNFECTDGLVKSQSLHDARVVTKSTFCARQYKDYRGLYDVMYLGGTVHESHKALLSHFTLSGVSEEYATRFLEKFISSVQWN